MGILSLISLRLECEFPLQNENNPQPCWGSYQAEGLAVIYKHGYNFFHLGHFFTFYRWEYVGRIKT